MTMQTLMKRIESVQTPGGDSYTNLPERLTRQAQNAHDEGDAYLMNLASRFITTLMHENQGIRKDGFALECQIDDLKRTMREMRDD